MEKNTLNEREDIIKSSNGWRLVKLKYGQVIAMHPIDLTDCHVNITYQRNVLPGISLNIKEVDDNDFL